MNKKFGYTIPIGLLIGTVFGFGIGTAGGNMFLGLGIGALLGGFLGWFTADAMRQNGTQ